MTITEDVMRIIDERVARAKRKEVVRVRSMAQLAKIQARINRERDRAQSDNDPGPTLYEMERARRILFGEE